VTSSGTGDPWLARPETKDHQPEELESHLRSVARLAASYASKFDCSECGHRAGLLHDAGKALTHFREYLQGNRERDGYNHTAAGAILSDSDLSVLIASHHTGLQSRADVANALQEEVRDERVQQACENAQELIKLEDGAKAESSLPDDPLRRAFLLRMLHSALIDADWTRVARHLGTFSAPDAPSIDALTEEMVEAQEKITDRSTRINRIRAEIREQCVDAAHRVPGIYTASIPTGGGKTRALMEMALRHARVHGHSRVIVLAPYVTILQQTAGVYRDIFGEEAVLEHHGGVELSRASTAEYERATSRWDRPIIVSTFVQALESLMHTSNSRLRKVHRFADSVVILDEIQNLPYDLRETTIWLIEELEELGATVIASSATQIPMPGTEVIDDPPDLYDRMKRVDYEYDLTEHTPEELWTLAHDCSMIVANTTADALRIAEANPDASHLSTKMTPAHRESVIQSIRERLTRDNGGRDDVQLVTTQIVEAGIDLDFDQAIRIWGPMDNVIQAAGRVNREGREALGTVLVTKLEEGGCPPGAYQAGTEVHEELYDLNGHLDLNDPTWLERYYERMEHRVPSSHPQIAEALEALDYPAAHEEYQLIDQAKQVDLLISDPEHGAPQKMVETLRNGEITRRLLRRAQRYMVTPYIWSLEEMVAEDCAELLREDLDLYLWTGSYDGRLGIT